MRALKTLIGFARLHTVVATTVQVITIFLIVVGWPATPGALTVIAATLATCLALNLYVVGLNQLTD
ncbi:MAG: homogentisate phytyltransferase, partial [Chloroflexaceae bacterium]